MTKEIQPYLTANDAVRLDPFNRINQPIREMAEDLLIFSDKGREKNSLLKQEEDAWFDILGADVDVKPLPEYVTPEVRQNLKTHGLELRYLPSLDLKSSDTLKSQGTQNYLKELAKTYPNWKRFEAMSPIDRANPSVSRNLQQYFWVQVKEGIIDFPQLPGQWLAVETIEKPSSMGNYARTLVGNKLGFEEKTRHGTPWTQLTEIFADKKPEILTDIGLERNTAVDLRLLEAIEWNLLANREGWGKTDTYEWTNTHAHERRQSLRVIVGDSLHGGASFISWVSPDSKGIGIGFRTAVILKDKKLG